MGVWGFHNSPSTPPDDAWEDMAEQESLEEFIEQEMSYEDAMGVGEEIFTDEGGWGAWMGGEL